jgi:hypothetical protein
MCTAFRYIEHPTVVGTQAGSVPGPVARRCWPEVHDNVKYRPPGTANEFGFERWGDLVVQTADGAFLCAETHIGLQGGEVDCMFSELTAAPRAQEPASCVYMRGRLDDPRAIDTTFAEIHFTRLVRPLSEYGTSIVDRQPLTNF